MLLDTLPETILSAASIQRDTENWAYVYGKPQHTARFRAIPEDFVVDESLPFELSGEGEHVYLQIQKTALNTMDVVQAIAVFANVPPARIGFAGQKDKYAVTTQWFSVHLPGVPELDWSTLENERIKLRSIARHQRKLKTGAVKSNSFVILLRSVAGECDDINSRLQLIQREGFANYFGEQRFGRGYSNLLNAQVQLKGKKRIRDRHARGMYYSSMRSWLFNEVLSARLKDQLWHSALPGDAIMLNGTKGFFITEQPDDVLQTRLKTFDVHLTGPLVGEGGRSKIDKAMANGPGLEGLQSALDAKKYEQTVLARYAVWCDWLAKEGLKSARRALRVVPSGLDWQWLGENELKLSFQLPAGSYATSVLRELVLLENEHA